jgi:hypothetical protein
MREPGELEERKEGMGEPLVQLPPQIHFSTTLWWVPSQQMAPPSNKPRNLGNDLILFTSFLAALAVAQM